ncbi:Endonuclease 4 [Rhynchospora pubera]|nr:Endonuclease 4 [Rhynchospora pubera]
MSLLFLLQILFFFCLISAPSTTDAWGKEGHFMVCKIAEKYFSEKTKEAVQDLLPEIANGDLASVCSWPDEVRFRYRWSSPLHYINTPGLCNYLYSRDCHNPTGQQGMCVVGAINNYTNQLYSYGDSKNTYNLTESLMFLSHFVGDVHQPLHVGFEADEGGNTIIVHWYRRKTNLHHVWDVSMIETAMKDFYDNDLNTMIDAIKLNITDDWSDELNKWENCQNKRATCANDYASESIKLSCSYAYKDVEQDSTLQDDYFYSRYPVVEKQIAKAGVRLAIILNHIFDAGTSYKMSSLFLQKE